MIRYMSLLLSAVIFSTPTTSLGTPITNNAMDISVNAPQLGSTEHDSAEFNTYIHALLDIHLARFKINAHATPTNILEQLNTPSYLNINYKMHSYQPGKRISIQFNEDSYVNGEAHPHTNIFVSNYDLQHHTTIELSQLFKPNTPYLTIIANFCRKALQAKDLGETHFIEQGTAPIKTNYQEWNITDSGLIFHFQAGQVAARVYGTQKIFVPFKQLDRVIIA